MLLTNHTSFSPTENEITSNCASQRSSLGLTAILLDKNQVTLRPFTEYLGQQLGATLTFLEGMGKSEAELRQQLNMPHDLLVLGRPPQPLLQRWLGRRAMLPGSAPILVVRQPRWPLERILLVVRADGQDETAVSWAGRLAKTTHAAVTLLPIVPTLPAMYGPQFQQQARMDVLLVSGGQLRNLAQQLADNRIGANLHLRPGEPAWQLRWEIAETNPDLVVLAAEARKRWPDWLLSDVVLPLLSWIDRPVLVTRSSKMS